MDSDTETGHPVLGKDVEDMKPRREDANVFADALRDRDEVREIAKVTMTEDGKRPIVSVCASHGPVYDPETGNTKPGVIKQIGVSIQGKRKGITPEDVAEGTEIRDLLETVAEENGFGDARVNVATRGSQTHIAFIVGHDPIPQPGRPLDPAFVSGEETAP